MHRMIAIIPARGGSKRVPRKNIKDFCGRPMIGWPISAARESGLFEDIIVSTEDDEIAAVAESLGAWVPFRRPAELADDFATAHAVTIHAVEWLLGHGFALDVACIIYPTAPFLEPDDLIGGYRQLVATGSEIVFSGVRYPFPIQRAVRLVDGRVEMFDERHFATRSQDLEPAYHDAGQFYFYTVAAVKAGTIPFSRTATLFEMPRHRVVDIDDAADWLLAERLAQASGPGSRFTAPSR